MAIVVMPATRGSTQEAGCIAPGALVRLDHAIVVVHNLDSATRRFAALGFRLKQGRLHADSLLNRHIKFRDGSEIELMSLAGRPTSRMAREYRRLLRLGEGGVYAALWTDSIRAVRDRASRIGVPRVSRLGAWQFLSLPGVPATAAVFVGAGGYPANDPDSVRDHENGAHGLAGAWVEGGEALERLLAALGAATCGSVLLPDGRTGTRWALARGSLVVVRSDGHRLLGVELAGDPTTAPQVWQPVPGFWLQFP